MTIQPLGNRVLVKTLEAKSETIGGIFLPENVKNKSNRSEIMAVGSGTTLENGDVLSPQVKVGDVVVTSSYGGTEIKVDNETLSIFDADDILAVIEVE